MNQELPWDMIFEVLFRTPLDTLNRCKMVSKGWKDMIYDFTFFPFYLKHTGIFFGFFVQDIYKSKFVGVNQTEEIGEDCIINKSWPLGNVKILASCNYGIVCCEKRNGKNYRWYVGKPATEQWKVMPNPNLCYKTVGVALTILKSKPLRFKIVRLSEMKINDDLKMEYACEIFDSKSWNWRRAQSTYLDYNESINVHQPGITIGGSVYWSTYSNNVLTFDITQQLFNKFSSPQTHVDAQNTRLVEYQGGLGFSCSMPNGNVQVWHLTNFKDNYEWKRKMNVDIRVVDEAFTYPKLVGFCDSDTSFMMAYNEVVFFNVKNDSFTSKEIDFELRHANQFFQFFSDVEHVNLRYVDQVE